MSKKSLCAKVALLALIGGLVQAQAQAQAQATPRHAVAHECKDSLHKAKQTYADTRLKVLKSSRTNWEQLAELDNHMADVQRIERTVGAGHPMEKRDCDMLQGQVKGLNAMMNDLLAKGSYAQAPRHKSSQAPSKK